MPQFDRSIYVSPIAPTWNDVEKAKINESLIPTELLESVRALAQGRGTDSQAQDIANNKEVREHIFQQPYLYEKCFARAVADFGEQLSKAHNRAGSAVVKIRTSTANVRSYNPPIGKDREYVTDYYEFTPEQVKMVATMLTAHPALVTKVDITTTNPEHDTKILVEALHYCPALTDVKINLKPVAEIAPLLGSKIEATSALVEKVAAKLMAGEKVDRADFNTVRSGGDVLRYAIANKTIEKLEERDKKIERKVSLSTTFAEVASLMGKSEIFHKYDLPYSQLANNGISGIKTKLNDALGNAAHEFKNGYSHSIRNAPEEAHHPDRPRGLKKGSEAREMVAGMAQGLLNALNGIAKTFAPDLYASNNQGTSNLRG